MGTTQLLYGGKFLELVKEGRWEYVDRVNTNGAVMIIAVTRDDRLLLVEEYRVPVHSDTIGLPAGNSGDQGEESFLQGAIRELEEEAGYRAKSWKRLFTGTSCPGLTSEMVTFFMASELERVSDGGGVDQEDIKVHAIPLSQVHSWLFEQINLGKVIDPKVFLALYFIAEEKNHELFNNHN